MNFEPRLLYKQTSMCAKQSVQCEVQCGEAKSKRTTNKDYRDEEPDPVEPREEEYGDLGTYCEAGLSAVFRWEW